MLGPIEARLSLLAGVDPDAARDAELGLRGVLAGRRRRSRGGGLTPGTGAPRVVLSARQAGRGRRRIVVRVLNPTDAPLDARLTLGVPFGSIESVRLDENPDGGDYQREGTSVRCDVPAYGLRSLRIRPNA